MKIICSVFTKIDKNRPLAVPRVLKVICFAKVSADFKGQVAGDFLYMVIIKLLGRLWLG